MWPFKRSITAPDDLRRLEAVEERTQSLHRQMAALLVDLEEFYAKVNKARQRVNKEERDASARAVLPDLSQLSPEAQKAELRRRIKGVG